MNIRKNLTTILHFLSGARRVGHTEAMIQGAAATDGVIVMALNAIHAKELQNRLPNAKVVSLSDPQCLVGRSAPLVLDNATLMELTGRCLSEFRILEREIEEMRAEKRKSEEKEEHLMRLMLPWTEAGQLELFIRHHDVEFEEFLRGFSEHAQEKEKIKAHLSMLADPSDNPKQPHIL